MDLPMNFVFRSIEDSDYDKECIPLLMHLSCIDPKKITRKLFNTFIHSLSSNHTIYVLEDTLAHVIVGSITMFVEEKIIHNMGKVAHIEDVVIHPNYQGKQLGKYLVKKVMEIAEREKCYKIILDCAEEKKTFYEKCGFAQNGIQMSKYF
jgi:glucosamine-phosphate N-acetyltransferase